MDFGPDEAIENFIEEGAQDAAEGGLEMKKEKTRRKMMAENRAILALIEDPNEAGICWLEQPDACSFTCFLCSQTVSTFSCICDHMDTNHPLDPSIVDTSPKDFSPAIHQCIACTKRFKKKNHLKVHV